MNLYCIINNKSTIETSENWRLLAISAEERGLNLKPIISEDFDFSKKIELEKGALLYRIGTTEVSSMVEKFLISDKIKHLYPDTSSAFSSKGYSGPMIMSKKGSPIIKTVFNPSLNTKVLKEQVDYLGGFPIVIKKLGLSHGAGVMKIDSFESLSPVLSFILSNTVNPADTILRSFIDYKHHYRLVVIGEKMVSSIEYSQQSDDFRTNAVDVPKVQPVEVSDEIKTCAIQATVNHGKEFGGIDILVDQDDQYHIAELNFPCNFSRSQNCDGTDISGMIIDYLISKKIND